MKRTRNIEALNKKCDLIQSLGFEIMHEDSRVEMYELEFDFSAIGADPVSIIKHAVKQAYLMGQQSGRQQIQSEVKSLLGIKEDWEEPE